MVKRLMALSTLIPSRSRALVGRALTAAGGREWCWHRFCPNVRLLSLGSIRDSNVRQLIVFKNGSLQCLATMYPSDDDTDASGHLTAY